MTEIDSMLKSRAITLATEVRLVKAEVSQWSCTGVRAGLWRKRGAGALMLLVCGAGSSSHCVQNRILGRRDPAALRGCPDLRQRSYRFRRSVAGLRRVARRGGRRCWDRELCAAAEGPCRAHTGSLAAESGNRRGRGSGPGELERDLAFKELCRQWPLPPCQLEECITLGIYGFRKQVGRRVPEVRHPGSKFKGTLIFKFPRAGTWKVTTSRQFSI